MKKILFLLAFLSSTSLCIAQGKMYGGPPCGTASRDPEIIVTNYQFIGGDMASDALLGTSQDSLHVIVVKSGDTIEQCYLLPGKGKVSFISGYGGCSSIYFLYSFTVDVRKLSPDALFRMSSNELGREGIKVFCFPLY